MNGCSINNKYNALINDNKLIKKTFDYQEFKSIVLFNNLYYSGDKSILYVFIEGDGIPWKSRTKISDNPDPKNPLALELMSINKAPSVYLSRPCYWIKNTPCSNQWWTNKRYSKQIVEHMLKVLFDISKAYKSIVLVGYSGGGALAALISKSLNKPTTLITLSGNMNHKKWTLHHGYSPLSGSLNPIDYLLPDNVKQFHFAGDKDTNVLPQWIKEYSNNQINGHYYLMKNTDHKCCWIKNWEKIIQITSH